MRIFRHEFKRNLKQTLLYCIVVLLVSIILTQIGINKMTNALDEEKDFITLEKKLVESYISYHQYGAHGIRLKYSPTPITALFSESIPFFNMTAFIDIGIRIYLYKEVTTNNAIAQNGYLDLNWFLKIIGSFLVLIWGWKTFTDQNYLKFLISIQRKYVKIQILLAKILFLLLILVIISGQVLLQFFINGYFVDVHLIIYMSIVFIVYVISLLISSYMGMKNTKKSKIILALIWIIFTLILPDMLKFYFEREAKSIIECKFVHELKKADILSRLEREAFEKAQRYPRPEQKFKVNVESSKKYLANGSKKMEKLEKQLIILLEKVIKKYQFFSSITPVTYLNSVGWEISSVGYRGYLNFYRYILETQRRFLKYVFKKLYYEAPRYGNVVPFLKEGENIFKFNSSMPNYYWFGMLWCMIFIFIMFWLNCHRFNKILIYPNSGIEEQELIIKKGEINILLTMDCKRRHNIFCYFANQDSIDFVYLYKSMDSIFKKKEIKNLLNEYSDEENWKTIFNHAKKNGKVLILTDFLDEVRKLKREDIIKYIKEEKIRALLITGNHLLACSLVPGDEIQLFPNDRTVDI